MKRLFKDDDSWTQEGNRFAVKMGQAIRAVMLEYPEYSARDMTTIATHEIVSESCRIVCEAKLKKRKVKRDSKVS